MDVRWQPESGARVRQFRVPYPRRLLRLVRRLLRDQLRPVDDTLRERHRPALVERRR